MRVALVTETFLPNVNGVVTTLCRLLEHVQAKGHAALLFAPWGAPHTYADTRIIPLMGVPLPLYPELNITPPQPGIWPHLLNFKPDVLHMVSPAVMGSIVPSVSYQLQVPLISSYHTDLLAYSHHYGLGLFQDVFHSYLRWLHNQSRITLCPSTATRDMLHKQGFRRLRVWGRGVDTERFHPNNRSHAWRESVGLQEGETLLLYVGRLCKEKRIAVLADALRGLDNVRLVLVGDGPERLALQERMHGLPVSFTGYLKGHSLATAYASADIFVFPSDTETFGQVVQEAMSSGVPVIGARSGGTRDLVHEGTTGYLFQPGDAHDLRRHIQCLVADTAMCRAMGEAGRAVAEKRSWDVIMDELLEYYHHVLRRTPRYKKIGYMVC